MILYQHHFCFVDETIALIENYVNDSTNSSHAKDDLEKNMFDRLLSLVNKAKELVQDDQVVLFKYVRKDDPLSLASLLGYAFCDFNEPTFEKQILSMKKRGKENRKNFIKELFSWYEVEIDEDRLVKKIDELPVDDSIKWKLWQVYNDLDFYVEQVIKILQRMVPIMDAYQDVYAYYLNRYEKEISQDHDLYERVCTMLHSHMDRADVFVLPSVAKMLSVSFIDQRDGLIFRYGVGMIDRILEMQTIPKEKLFDGLKVLSDPSKFEILCVLDKEALYGAKLAEKLNLSTPTISYHMQSLISARFVTFEKKQNRLYYRMDRSYIQLFIDRVKEVLNIES